jgi:multiple sugar transport system substrate-binding protein
MRRYLAICLLVAVVLAGCTAAPKKATETAKTGVVRVLVLGGSGLEPTLVSTFKAANPGVTVESVELPEGEFKDVVAKLKSGEAKVDAIIAPANSFLLAQGVALQLDDLVKSEQISLSEYGDTLELAKYGGKLYGLPVTLSPMVVAYNKDLFAKAGLKNPAAGWTWTEYVADARALAKLMEKENTFGTAIPGWTLADLLLTAGKGPAGDDLKPVQEMLERVLSLQADPKIMSKVPVFADDTEFWSGFARGEIAMLLNYWENSFAHQTPEFQWGLAPLPGGGKTPGIATLAMVATKAENRENAMAFLKMAGGPMGGQAVVRIPGAPLPGFVNETIQSEWLAHSSLKEDSAFVLRTKYLPSFDYPEDLAALLLKEADAALKGQKTPEEAVKAYQQARTPLLSKK